MSGLKKFANANTPSKFQCAAEAEALRVEAEVEAELLKIQALQHHSY
jgi:hypothetical protein